MCSSRSLTLAQLTFCCPHPLGNTGSRYISGDLAEWLKGPKMQHDRGAPFHPQTQGIITPRDISCGNALPISGTLASNHEEPCPVGKFLPARRS